MSIKQFTLTTPAAIIIGSVILAVGLVGYGYVSKGGSGAIASKSEEEFLGDTAKVLGGLLNSNVRKWEACREDTASLNSLTAKINESINDGIAAGVTGTPTSFIVVKSGNQYKVASTVVGGRDYAYMKAALDSALASTTTFTDVFKGKAIADSEFVQGKRDKVFFVEYSDAECPYCIGFHPTVTQIVKEYSDRIGFVYRHFPLTQIHPDAMGRAVAIECAGQVGGVKGYFDFIEKLFDTLAS
jgi:protein-disulfide isomerase